MECEKKTITLRTQYAIEGKPTEFTNVIFDGVEAYHFWNDAFGNIIFSVDDVSAEQFLKEYGSELSELYRFNGKLTWAADLACVPERMRDRELKAYLLFSSYGLCGWVLTKEMRIVPV